MKNNKPESRHDDKHWLRHLHGGTAESHTEFLLHGHKRVFSQHPSKRSLQNHIVRLSRLIDELRTEQEALQAEREELRKDAERLDFIAQHPGWLRSHKGRWGCVSPFTNYSYPVFKTPRDAIDAAMQASHE